MFSGCFPKFLTSNSSTQFRDVILESEPVHNHFHARDRLLLLGHAYTLMGEASNLWRAEQKELKGSRGDSAEGQNGNQRRFTYVPGSLQRREERNPGVNTMQ